MAYRQRDTTALFIILAVLTSAGCSQEPDRCLQNCSWTSYGSGGEKVENGCEMLVEQDMLTAYDFCPNYYESYSEAFPPEIDIVDVSYYDVSSKGSSSPSGFSSIVSPDETTSVCANISFKIAQSGAERVKAIRLTIFSKIYSTLNDVFCQVWNLTTSPLTGCSFSAGHCDPNNQYTFYYDCFCGVGANSGGYGTLDISVDALPKVRGKDQVFESFHAPSCEDHPTNRFCQQTPKENWRPLHSSCKQWCNNTHVNLTFDLAPWEYQVREYYVFLYPLKKNSSHTLPYGKREKKINVMNIETFVMEYHNQTFNMTTVTFTEDVESGQSYIPGFRIADDDGTYFLRKESSAIVTTVEPFPCSQNPCSVNETCIPDCLTYSCQCVEGTQRNKNGTCKEKVLPVKEPSGFPSFLIEIIGTAGGCLVILIIVGAAYFVKGRSYQPCKRGGTRNTQDPLIPHPVELPESPKGSHSVPNGIRLVCNHNSRLQNFTDKLRQVLQEYVGCPVSVHTVWLTTQVGSSSWIADAKNKEEKVLFIWDKNLSILDYGDSPVATKEKLMVHNVVSTLQRNELESIVILQLDIANSAPLPIELRHCCTFSLPGGLRDLIKDFSLEENIPSDCFSDVISAYKEIKESLRQNVCQSSKHTWTEREGNLAKGQESGGDVASDESELSDEDALIEEEEAGQELLSSLSQSG